MRRLVVAVAAAAVLVSAAPAVAAPGPPSAPEYWFDQWHVTQLWADGAQGQGITIAEIDTGVNAQLPELAGRILSGKDFGQSGNGQIDRQTDQFGHGTAMASIMVARPGLLGITGLVPDAKVLPIAVPLNGTTDAAPDDHLASAIRYAVDRGAKIISMSLGGTRDPADDAQACPADEQAAIYYALSKNVVLFAADGNRGTSDNAVEEPGVCLGVVSVGAVDSSGTVAAFSSRHAYLTVTAPGVNIASLSRIAGQAYSGSGTSQATALASAVAAMVWSRYPTLTGEQLVTRLLATLERRTTKPSPSYGYGIIDAYQAVTTAVIPQSAANPVYADAAPFREFAAKAAVTPTAVQPPRAAAQVTGSTGPFVPGVGPALIGTQTVGGIALALAGLVLLVIVVVRERRRRRRVGPAASARAAPVTVAAPQLVDETGLVWHEIIPPDEPTQLVGVGLPPSPPRPPKPAEPQDLFEYVGSHRHDSS